MNFHWSPQGKIVNKVVQPQQPQIGAETIQDSKTELAFESKVYLL